LILRGTFIGNSDPLSDSKVVPDIIDKYKQEVQVFLMIHQLTNGMR